ncbi:hypothetical protein HELRODRAFT_102639 [Helobdella robusta]|uniref:RING-type E3 ubiquitin transferase n=1 Tax=Helobdella robusta TaxID=6412 RepID=T1EDA7_HELRO|nr:hypothetical protein HELRODRAFT_102639 [Helobdella robusta]ESN95417.1 hypothetical protein HELRODRAFT_102639 [Helobdella robusta]
MKEMLVGFLSAVLTAGVIFNAFNQKKQFYPSVVYITKSSPSMAILYAQALVLVVFLGKFMRKVFFGQLRPAEMEHLIERSWYAVTETCLAFTVFRDDFSPRFVALFTMLLFVKCFHWLAEDRVDYFFNYQMERSPVISVLFHARAIALLALLTMVDLYFTNHAYHNTLIKGPSVQLVFGFEYAILLTMVLHILIKYMLHTIDRQNENPWENKAVYLLYSELMLGFLKVVLYILFLIIMVKVHTFPLFVVRPMYLTFREFKKAMNDVILSRRAIHNMNTLYPTATPEELASGDNVCIICREEMHSNAKKLPCNHIFHSNCLRSWFQRQQTCPTCRMDVFRNTPASTNNRQQAAVPQAAANAQQPQAADNVQPQQPAPQQMPPNFPGFVPIFFPPQGLQPNPLPVSSSQSSSSSSSLSSSSTSSQQSSAAHTATTSAPGISSIPQPFSLPFIPSPHSFLYPSSSMMPPYSFPFGFPPTFGSTPSFQVPNLAQLTAFELQAMEGQERRNVEARIQCLRDIQTLLTAAVNQMQQYMSVVVATTAASHDPSPVSLDGGRSGSQSKDSKNDVLSNNVFSDVSAGGSSSRNTEIGVNGNSNVVINATSSHVAASNADGAGSSFLGTDEETATQENRDAGANVVRNLSEIGENLEGNKTNVVKEHQ